MALGMVMPTPLRTACHRFAAVRVQSFLVLIVLLLPVTVQAGTVETASGVMTHVWSLCQRRLVETLSCELKTLWCPECGASLEEIPQEGAPVKCKHCDQWIHAIIK